MKVGDVVLLKHYGSRYKGEVLEIVEERARIRTFNSKGEVQEVWRRLENIVTDLKTLNRYQKWIERGCEKIREDVKARLMQACPYYEECPWKS